MNEMNAQRFGLVFELRSPESNMSLAHSVQRTPYSIPQGMGLPITSHGFACSCCA